MSIETRLVLRSNARRGQRTLLDEDMAVPDAGSSAEERDVSAEMQTLIALGARAVKHLPETRRALIEDLRARIQAGTYQPDSAVIARKMLGIEEECPSS